MEYNVYAPLLIKLGSKEHMQSLYDKGQLHMNTFSYFQNLEKKEDKRADQNEYLSEHYSGTNALNKRNITLEYINPNTKEKETHLLSSENGLLAISIRQIPEFYTNLFCMSIFEFSNYETSSGLIDISNFSDDKDYAVIVFNVKEFIERIKLALSNLSIPGEAKKVEYVDPKNYEGKMGCFKKFNEYALQKEWRLAVRFNDNTPHDIYIGSLKDIAFQPIYKDDFSKITLQLKEAKNG